MTPPETPANSSGNPSPAASVCPKVTLDRLKRRSDFLAAARARYKTTNGMTVQARDRGDGDPLVRVGFTCSKKVGNAVARNRAKRRLREIARLMLPDHGQPGFDYVLIGRRDATAERPFDALGRDLLHALDRLHAE